MGTFQLMFVLDFLLVLNYKQGDVTSAFIHEYIPKDDKVYIEISRGFEPFYKNGCKKCLKLKINAFCNYTMYKLEQCGLKQSNFIPDFFW